ncbi:putative sulfolipid biosynthesis protein [Oceanicola granulosus HTCC2516]|uniref:Putative sulfolipid biosynthesis protein n=1 Tax=Oceanicola granulosus (strain ATCC BAA-861 / DSM 15982 / KCTC 12143 / HTCC2516) TaxID=314256 RepID=Q2CDK7_OCEGH|nr:SDR family oxidoreductase [Oceanicola granulosus]EAR50704.1 putative sulfolipid biosynthesis protein [Oceanicola granulosus HTCC2516]
MRLAVTGASGLVGRFVVAEALARGDAVTVLGRAPVAGADWLEYDLRAPPPSLEGIDALVHCAFLHVPGRYRGGEGDDPDGFRRANVEGTAALFEAARKAGVEAAVFLSSRAVYGPVAGPLTETAECRPDTLYGEVKLAGEQALAASGLRGASLRATGVYGAPGPGLAHKWEDLFAAFARGEEIAPRIGTEVHGRDLAAAVRLALERPGAAEVLNVSDLLLDRAELLALWAEVSGVAGRVPAASERAGYGEMDTGRLRARGWRPGGRGLLRETLEMWAASGEPG